MISRNKNAGADEIENENGPLKKLHDSEQPKDAGTVIDR
jgi:hypothetical protein